VREESPCRAGPRALAGNNTFGAVRPAVDTRYPESSATSCAARLRECRAHGSARMGATSPGEPRPVAPFPLHIYKVREEITIFLPICKDVSICANTNRCVNLFVHVYLDISIHPCLYVSIHPSIHPSIHLFIYLSLCIHLSISIDR
jgi:hypothetical protein